MEKVLVVFASRSNKRVYDRVVAELSKLGVQFEFRVCSAHKTPDELDVILRKDYSLIIAGAGMAAHLAGVIAARKVVPVIGVPCSDSFSGLDAFLSTLQMPPGIPVLCVGVDCAEEAALAASLMMKKPSSVSVMVKSGFAERAADTLSRLGARYELSYVLAEDSVNIRFVPLDEVGEAVSDGKLVINCPVSEKANGRDALRLLSIRQGLWVGLNRADNAAVAAAGILGMYGAVSSYRQEVRSAVVSADKEECVVQ